MTIISLMTLTHLASSSRQHYGVYWKHEALMYIFRATKWSRLQDDQPLRPRRARGGLEAQRPPRVRDIIKMHQHVHLCLNGVPLNTWDEELVVRIQEVM